MNMFVGNLSFASTQEDVKKYFEGFGNVTSVAIVMSKEKKAPKSRGFGFVEMPDEQQALAAISALNGKEFMGRVLNIEPARPKVQKAMVLPPIAKAEAKQESKLIEVRNTKEVKEEKKVWGNSILRKPGAYRGGRRTHSYRKRRGLVGMQEEVKPRRKSQDNPMRWRKIKDQPKPWQKSSGENKPWKKAEGGPNPWKKPEGGPKPWSKSSGRPQESRFKVRRKPGGYKR